jgi:hypothetical protein
MIGLNFSHVKLNETYKCSYALLIRDLVSSWEKQDEHGLEMVVKDEESFLSVTLTVYYSCWKFRWGLLVSKSGYP